jgi:hypothetical protein
MKMNVIVRALSSSVEELTQNEFTHGGGARRGSHVRFLDNNHMDEFTYDVDTQSWIKQQGATESSAAHVDGASHRGPQL